VPGGPVVRRLLKTGEIEVNQGGERENRPAMSADKRRGGYEVCAGTGGGSGAPPSGSAGGCPGRGLGRNCDRAVDSGALTPPTFCEIMMLKRNLSDYEPSPRNF
jgi:hypothetical protein